MPDTPPDTSRVHPTPPQETQTHHTAPHLDLHVAVDTCVRPTARHGPFHPCLDVCHHPHMWTLPMDTLPPPPGRSCHPTVVPRHTWTHPSSQTQTHTDTPSPGGLAHRYWPRRPALGRHAHQAHWARRPHCHAATWAALLCALFSGTPPSATHTHTHTHTHTRMHVRMWVCSLAFLPQQSTTPWTTQSGSGGGSMADQPPVHLPGTAQPQESGTQTPHWTLYSFPAMATGGLEQGFVFPRFWSPDVGNQGVDGAMVPKAPGEGLPCLFQFLEGPGLVATSPISTSALTWLFSASLPFYKDPGCPPLLWPHLNCVYRDPISKQGPVTLGTPFSPQ